MADYSTEELSALRRVYASGALVVSYEGKTVTYESGAAILKRIRQIEDSIATSTSNAPAKVGLVSFSRGS